MRPLARKELILSMKRSIDWEEHKECFIGELNLLRFEKLANSETLVFSGYKLASIVLFSEMHLASFNLLILGEGVPITLSCEMS